MQEFYVNATRSITPSPSAGSASWVAGHCMSHRFFDVVDAAQLAQTSQLSFWDAMIVHSAGALGCSTLWSEDLNDGQQIAGVTVRNPFRS